MSSEERPLLCRNRLRDEGKPHPRSGCAVCRNDGLRGCPYENRAASPSPDRADLAEAISVPVELPSREEIARIAALRGLGSVSGAHRTPPNASWSVEEWERRILECVPEQVEQECYALADAVLALLKGRRA